MNKSLRILSFVLILVLIAGIGAYAFTYFYLKSLSVPGGAEGYPVPEHRVNVLVVGVARGLSDSIMLCSFDMKDNTVNVYSIPRDTYYPGKKNHHGANAKINASYGRGGADEAVKSVSDLTGVPIHYYVKIDYKAVKAIVDAVGGIKVEIPLDMNYDDPADDLHIHFKKGDVVSSGEDMIKILRFRKNNHGGGYAEGDLGRIKMQQKVVKLGMQKVLSGNLVANFVKLQGPIKEYVKTNMSPKQMMYYISKAAKVKEENITIRTIPGEAKKINSLWFFVADEEKLAQEMADIKAKQ